MIQHYPPDVEAPDEDWQPMHKITLWRDDQEHTLRGGHISRSGLNLTLQVHGDQLAAIDSVVGWRALITPSVECVTGGPRYRRIADEHIEGKVTARTRRDDFRHLTVKT